MVIPQGKHPLTESQLKKQLTHTLDLDFFTATTKVKLKTDSESIKGKMWLRAQPDSVIWAVVKRASIEGGRIQMTEDSTSVIYRLDKSYQTIPNSDLGKDLGINADLTTLTYLLLGHNLPCDTTSLWQVAKDSSSWQIKTAYDDFLIDLNADLYSGHVTHGRIVSNFQGEGQFSYSDHREVEPDIWIPFKRIYSFSHPSHGETRIELSFSEIKLNERKAIKFEIPSHYQRIK